MPLTKANYNDVLSQCNKIWDAIINNNGHIVYVPDGTIYADINNGNNTFITYQINATCCKILKENFAPKIPSTPSFVNPSEIYFDLDEQKCRWAKPSQDVCSTASTPIKIVLNPKGNDGVFFTLTEDDTCRLDIKFDYLFKISCETLFKTISTSTYLKQNDVELKVLMDKKFDLETELLSIENELSGLTKLNLSTNYSVICNEFPTSTEEIKISTKEITQTQKLPFTNTGFGSLTNNADLSTNKIAPIYSTKPITFCLTEDGLTEWKKILGVNNYVAFLDGDPNSYTCKHVIRLDELNTRVIINNSPRLIFECTTPFGEKTSIIKKILELSTKQQSLNNSILLIDSEISGLNSEDKDPCETMVGQFETLKARVSIDYIDDNGVLQPFWSETLFPIPQITNLYTHIKNNGTDSGFLVCGEPTPSETWASDCTPLIYDEFTNGQLPQTEIPEHLNVSICDGVKDQLYSELYSQYQTLLNNGGSQSDFESSLNPNVFNSNWLTYEKTITGVTTITNQRIKLNIEITDSCGNFCLLVDQINLTKVCTDSDRADIFISESPGFNLTRIIDNKKSWLEAEETNDRVFYVGDVNDNNKIRQTEYSLDEERLILNSKEIDLTMNMASAVENDVWCYLLDNSNLLTGTTNDCSTTSITPSDIYGNPVVLPTAQTYTYNVNDVIKLALGFQWGCSEAIHPNYPECYPESECLPCGKALKFKTKSPYGGLWVVCDTQGLSVYYITDATDAQGTINNITYSLTGSAISNLTNLVNVTNFNLNSTNPEIQQYEIFWDSTGDCISCCKNCGDKRIDFTGFMTTNITEVKTLETFENLMVSELTDVKNRKVLSSYPTLRAVYDRYINATQYGVPKSNEFDYQKMDKFTSLVKTYWDDLIEQVVPATTMWGSIKVYTNTLFDQQKFKYRSYSSLFCDNPLNFVAPPSPINGSEGQCEDVEVITYDIQVFPNEPGQPIIRRRPVKYNSVCLTQMNWGSEFVGNVDIQDGSGNFINNDGFCNQCRKAVWYSMPESPAFVMNIVECGLMPETGTTFVINSFTVNNGNELISVPLTSDTVTNDSVIWVPANNTVISACTLGNTTGWTYTNFVNFLNETFIQLGLTEYEARLSYIEIDSQTFSDGSVVGPPQQKNRAGFYLLFPENDTFELRINCTTQLGGQQTYVYSNNNLYIDVIPYGNVDLIPYANSSFGVSLAVNYDCKTDTINE